MGLTWKRVAGPVIEAPPADPVALYETTKRFGMPPVPSGLFDVVPWPEGAPRSGRIFAGIGDFRTAMENAVARAGVDYFLRMVITGHAVPRELDTHQRYEPESEAEILAVGCAIEADPAYQSLLNLARDGLARKTHARNYAKLQPE